MTDRAMSTGLHPHESPLRNVLIPPVFGGEYGGQYCHFVQSHPADKTENPASKSKLPYPQRGKHFHFMFEPVPVALL